MWRLHRLHIVDSALAATSNSAPQSQQVMLRWFNGRSTTFGAGLGISLMRRYRPHARQFVENAVRGSACSCPQCGHEIWIVSGFLAGILCCPAPAGRRQVQRPSGLAGSGTLGTSPGRAGAAVGDTLLGLTSDLPTNVTPSSTASFEARMSPNISVLALISIFSLAVMLPLTLPRTTTDWALMLPLMTALSPRFNSPSVWISPSSFPSNVSSPENLRLPLISTSEFNTFFELLVTVLISCSIV